MSSRNKVQFQECVVHKQFIDNPELLQKELHFYQLVPWAAPKLIHAGDDCLIIERLTPASKLPLWKPIDELYDLLKRIHNAGVNHRDVHIGNIVCHPVDGPLLIDWEHATDQVESESYDLVGPASGVEPLKGHNGDPGQPMWIGSDHRLSIKRQWK